MNIAWDSTGDGAPLLLIQGLGYGRWGWGPLVPGLAERYRVLTFDNRGVGESDKPEGAYTTAEMAQDALQVLDEAEVERAHVLGASLGGMIAQELAAAHPERVDKLVLACTTPGGSAGLPMPEVTVRLFEETAGLDPLEAMRLFTFNAFAPAAPAELVEGVFRRRLENPPDPVGWQGQAAAGMTFAGVSEPIDAPTLILTGTADNVVDPGNADLLAARIPGARVERIEGGGHMFFWEQPDACVRIVSEFLG
jgi:3-oxoadipate enol-lactonase